MKILFDAEEVGVDNSEEAAAAVVSASLLLAIPLAASANAESPLPGSVVKEVEGVVRKAVDDVPAGDSLTIAASEGPLLAVAPSVAAGIVGRGAVTLA